MKIKLIILFVLGALFTSCASFIIPPYGYVTEAGKSNKSNPVYMPESAPSISQGFKPEPSHNISSSGHSDKSGFHNGIDINA